MKAGAHPVLAQGKVRYVGDQVAVVIADSMHRPRSGGEDNGRLRVLPAVVDTATAANAGQPQIHDEAPNNTVFNWHVGDKASTDAAFAKAAHVTKLDLVNNRLIPNAMEPRAAIGEYDSGTEAITLYTTSQNPHVARLVLSAFIGSRRNTNCASSRRTSAAASARRSSSMPRRRSAPGRRRKSTGRSNGRRSERNRSCRTRTAAITSTHAELAMDAERQDPRHARPYDRQPRRVSVDLRVVGADHLYAHAAVRPVRHPRHLLRGRRGLHQHRAGRRLSRRRPSGGDLRRRASGRKGGARDGPRSGRIPAGNFVKTFPHQTPVILAYDIGDYAKALDKALELADYKGVGARKAASASERQAARRRLFRLYRSVRPRAVGRGRLARRAASGLWESAEVRVNPIGTVEILTGSHSHGQGHETTFAQLVSSRLGIPIENVSIVHGDTDKVQFGMGTYGSRSGAVGMAAIFKALDKIETKAKKVAGHVLEASEQDIEFKDGKFRSRAPTRRSTSARSRSNAYTAHKFNGQELEPGLKETAFWDPTNFTFPAGVHICELEIDPRDRRRDDRQVDRGRRLRQAHQSDDRRRPGAWRDRAGHRPGAARRRVSTTATASC